MKVWAALIVMSVWAFGCGSSDSNPTGETSGVGGAGGMGVTDGGGAQSCTSSSDCAPMGCECGDGSFEHGVERCHDGACVDIEEACQVACSPYGGLVSFGPEGTVEGSAECTAFCDVVHALPGCENAKCNQSFWCEWGYGECPDGMKQYLQCVVEKGTFQCNGPDSWMYEGGGCLHFKSECD